jgi:hypothetical protein
MFQSPIYQWWAGAGVDAGDGSQTNGWDGQLAGLSATDVGDPIFREDVNGEPAVEYDGTGDGHDWSPDSQLPTGTSGVSVVALWRTPSPSEVQAITGYDVTHLEVVSGSYGVVIQGGDNVLAGSVPDNTYTTSGYTYDGSQFELFIEGSGDNTVSRSPSLNATDAAHGYRRNQADSYADLQLVEVIYCAGVESDQAFAEYHSDRLE